MDDNIVFEIIRGETGYEWFCSNVDNPYVLLGLLDCIKHELLRDIEGQFGKKNNNVQIREVPE